MAEMLGLSVRLLVVRCLAFAVVQALMRARGNAGAKYVARYLMMTLERSFVRSFGRSVSQSRGTGLRRQSGQAMKLWR